LDDDEAFAEWAKWIEPTGLNPEWRVFRLDDETNYWPAGSFTKGPPGPCGPNSEMFYWVGEGDAPTGPYTAEDYLRDDAAGNWLEIWNDVFISYEWQGVLKNADRPAEGYEKTGMPDLPFRSIDTGMGLDRTAAVLGGLKSVYDTDAFKPIIGKIESIAAAQGVAHTYGSDAEKDRAVRIISDHIRTAVFCIADGILPGNNGRGYVLRRLIRRAVLKGVRVLGFKEAFFHEVYEGVVEAMGSFYTELEERRATIVETLKNEEALFRRTLSSGLARLTESLNNRFIRSLYDLRETEFPLACFSWFRPISETSDNTLDSVSLWRIAGPDSDFESRASEAKYYSSPENLLRDLAELYKCGLDSARDSSNPQLQKVTPLVLPGAEAFFLYDTYGFPLEVTIELCEEVGVSVDVDGYEAALKAAQELSRGSQDRESVYGGVSAAHEVSAPDAPETTHFLGYHSLKEEAKIVRLRGNLVSLDRTPFYAESGGQTGDKGTLEIEGRTLNVVQTTKSNNVWWHELDQPLAVGDLGKTVTATVDADRRARILRNHTATHLLQAALRTVLGTHVTQAGSYVGPENLRFDFTHGKGMTAKEIEQVEQIVNREALRNTAVQIHVDLPIAEAKARGAMALFGEKYGNLVRMVEIGEFSKELCGGTHVKSTGEVGLFKIVSESSAASGVRRIEAITGEAAYDWVREQNRLVRESAAMLKSNPKDVLGAIERVIEAAKEERKKREKAEAALAMGGSGDSVETHELDGFKVAVRQFENIDGKIVAEWVDDTVARNFSTVVIAGLVNDGKVTFTVKVGKDVGNKVHAGNLIREIAKVAGGSGGGRPDFATAGGKDASKVADALAHGVSILKG
jgi:alanyl-tRNA synthetase